MDKELLSGYLADGLTLREIAEFEGCHLSTVSIHLKRHGLTPNGAAFAPKRTEVTRSQLEGLLAAGTSLREIGAELGLSPSTVRYWMAKYDLTAAGSVAGTRAERLSVAAKTGDRERTEECPVHGDTVFQLDRDGSWRCLRCRSDAVAMRRRRVKQILVEEAGGQCVVCGYDRWVGALHFHHRDPRNKSFALSRAGITRSLDSARREATKCELLCANCHAEVEAGVAKLPEKRRSGGLPHGESDAA